MAMKAAPEYLARVKKLSKLESERLLTRATGRLSRRLRQEMPSAEEVMAIQLALEDEQLREWRQVMRSLREMEAARVA